jgi:myo-inositol-1(or 4)-monophosphatase
MNIPRQTILDVMVEAAEKSAEIIRDNFKKSDAYSEKTSNKDIVTEIDKLSQKNIREVLTRGWGKMGMDLTALGFVEEESKSDDVRECNFIVDPIDGTSNFASGIPFSCVSIAFSENGEIVVGLVLDPFSKRRYWAIKNEGSFVTDGSKTRSLKVANRPIKDWVIGAHVNGMEVYEQQFESYKKLYSKIRAFRNFGSLTLDACLVADGAFDAVLNKGCYFWDLAAVSLIVEEAGGDIYDFQGEKIVFDWVDTKKKYHAIIAHPEIKEALVSRL